MAPLEELQPQPPRHPTVPATGETTDSYRSKSEFLQRMDRFASEYLAPNADRIDREDRLPPDLLARLAGARLLALESLADQGPHLSLDDRLDLLFRVLERFGRRSPVVAKLVLDQNLGQVEMIRSFARPPLAQRCLSEIRAGQAQAAFLMTEPHSGSNRGSWRCCARPVPGGFAINGQKDWITGADERALYVVVARSTERPSDFGLFLVDRRDGRPGAVTLSHRKEKLGMRGLAEYRVMFDETFVPDDHVLLAPAPAAFRQVLVLYGAKRAGSAAIALGIARAALATSHARLHRRYPQAGPGSPFPSADLAFAEMFADTTKAAALVDTARRALAAGEDAVVTTALAKLVASETAVSVTNRAIQLSGAEGLSRSLPLERWMRDARMLTIAGGSSEVLKLTVAARLEALLAAESEGPDA